MRTAKGYFRKNVKHTSENAGTLIFLYLFHSSPSETTMFLPKNDSTLYEWIGLGHKYRDDATCWEQIKGRVNLHCLTTYLDSSSIRQHKFYPYARIEVNLHVPTIDMIRTVSSGYNWHSRRWKYPIPSLWTLCSKCHSHHQARICGRAVYLRSCFSMNEKLFPMHIPGILIGIMVPGILSWWKNTRYPVWLLWYRSNICLLRRLIGCLTRTWYQIARHDTQERVEEAQEYWSPPQGLLQNRQRGLAYWLGVGTFGKAFSAFCVLLHFLCLYV